MVRWHEKEERIAIKTIFDITQLNLWYNQFKALRDIDLKIYENEITAIIGPSGCGKSTFLKTLNLMVHRIPSVHIEGNIWYKEKDLLKADIDLVELRKEVGMVFQKGNPFPKSIYENVAFGPQIHGIKHKKELDPIIESSLKKVALWDEVKDCLDSDALSLSGGQSQRLTIARAIATNPEVILMDEPTSALDPLSSQKIEQLILNLKEKYSIVIVTHNMQQASRISDRTAFFLDGNLIEYDSTDSIFTNPTEQETENYITGRFG